MEKEPFDRLIQTALRLGASRAGVIPTANIVVEDELANLCNGSPACENYGLSPSCPPHVSGPAGFRKLQTESIHSIVVRIDVPTTVMFSEERREIMRLLHEIVAQVESQAVRLGYPDSKAFAGGSCKMLFCHEYARCRVLSRAGECRNPQSARPSMSGFGIHVNELMKTLGWSTQNTASDKRREGQSMTWVAGMILITDGRIGR